QAEVILRFGEPEERRVGMCAAHVGNSGEFLRSAAPVVIVVGVGGFFVKILLALDFLLRIRVSEHAGPSGGRVHRNRKHRGCAKHSEFHTEGIPFCAVMTRTLNSRRLVSMRFCRAGAASAVSVASDLGMS